MSTDPLVVSRLLSNAAGLPLPVYLSEELVPSASPVRGPLPHPVVVCSLHKAGT